MHAVCRRKVSAVGLVAAAGLAASGLAAIPATAAGGLTIAIYDPARSGQPVAGPVELGGSVRSGRVTVLYLLDATGSTGLPAGNDCNGDGTVTAADDLNGDALLAHGGVGDVLDCEIGGVQRLNAQLSAANPGAAMLVGVGAFAESAQVASLNAAGTQIFAAPGDTGGEAQPRIITAATSVQRGAITSYVHKDLGALHHSSYDPAIATALQALGTAPAGPKWIVLLSDGQTTVTADTLAALTSSGVHLSSFAVGTDASCDKHPDSQKPTGALAKMSAAAGEVCVAVPSPGGLADQLSAAHPDGIDGVAVTVGPVTEAAQLDLVGGWHVKFTLGQGSYTVTATASFTSGQAATDHRSFSVGTAPGSGGPKPGTVSQGPGALLATAIQVQRPKPSRASLPGHVTGTVGLSTQHALVASKRLNGATVLLQGRSSVGAAWSTLGRDTVTGGTYALHWQPRRNVHLLRVLLPARGDLAGSSSAVPVANISACIVKRHATTWSMTCHTTAAHGSKVRLYKGKHVVDRAKASGGLVKVHAAGRPGGHVLVVKLSRKHHAHQAHLAL